MSAGYETRIGYVSIKTSEGVYFYVGRYTNYGSTNSVINYQREVFNIGGAMNLTSGVFTAPVSGWYQFNFVAKAYADRTYVHLSLNGVFISTGQGWGQYDNVAMTATVYLRKNDRVDTWLYRGEIEDVSNTYYTQFTGILLEEDLVLS